MQMQNIDPIFTCTNGCFFQLGAVHVYLGALRAWFSQRAIWTPGPLCESNMKHTFEHLPIYTVNSEKTTANSLVSVLGLLGGFSALMSQPTTPTNIPGVSRHCSSTSQVGWQIMICKYNQKSFSLLRTPFSVSVASISSPLVCIFTFDGLLSAPCLPLVRLPAL